MARIFVSYTNKDRDWAFWIAQELEKLGHTPHVHEWEIPAGGNIAAWMEKRLDDADHVLCVISSVYLSKDYSSWERQSAQWEAVSNRSDFVLPVFVEACKAPRLLAPLRRCDIYGLGEEDARVELANYLKPAVRPDGPFRFPGAAKSPDTPIDRSKAVAFPGSPNPPPSLRPRNLPFISLGALFMGRDQRLDDLRAALAAAKGAPVVLYGLGGVGKTRLAIEYALRHEADYSALLFVRAGDSATLEASLAALVGADALDLDEKGAPQDAAKIDAALKWLAAHPPWLIILDNVDDGEAVKAAMRLTAKLRGGHVIITARAANFPAGVRMLALDALDEDAATEFLLERTRDCRAAAADDAAKAREIARELGGLALGLEQAGAFIATERSGFDRYLRLWRESRDKVLGWSDSTLTGSERTLATTWTTSVDRLSPESRRLLDRLAMLAPDPIPDSLLDVPVPREPADADVYEARKGLFAYSLVAQAKDEDGSAKGFVMHRLVQDFARRAMTEERRGEALREALGWVNDAFVGDPQDVRNWAVLDPLAPHALAVALRADEARIPEPTGRLFGQLGVLLDLKARYVEAEHLKRRGVAIGEATLGPDDPELATRLNNLAELLRRTNRPGEAEPLIRRALAISEKSLGLDHPDVAIRLNNLALLLKQMNCAGEAELLYRRALKIDEASYGPDHPEVATGLSNLVELLRTTNRFDEAEPLIRRALAISEKSLGPAHPDVAIRLSNLAGLLAATNRLDEAQQLCRRALTILEKSLAVDHPNTATVRKNLAALEAERNRGM